MKTYDAIVIGGGPAGLSAAIYLARSNRSVLVIDKGDGRSQGKQRNENYLGFPAGIQARRLSKLGKQQAARFGAEFADDVVLASKHVKKSRDGAKFALQGTKRSYRGRGVIIATGVKDIFPSFPGAKSYIGTSIFWCMMCDAWKVRGAQVLVVGQDTHAVKTCLKLLNYTQRLSFLIDCEKGSEEIDAKAFREMKKHKIPVRYGIIASAAGRGGKGGKTGALSSVTTQAGETIRARYIFSKLGYAIRNEIAIELGAAIEGKGFIQTDKEQRTSLPFLYAAGDVTNDVSHQIITAAHQGAVAAASLDEDLLEDFQR